MKGGRLLTLLVTRLDCSRSCEPGTNHVPLFCPPLLEISDKWQTKRLQDAEYLCGNLYGYTFTRTYWIIPSRRNAWGRTSPDIKSFWCAMFQASRKAHILDNDGVRDDR